MSVISKFCQSLSSSFTSRVPQHFPLGTCKRVVNGQLKLHGRESNVTTSTTVNGELNAKEVHFSSLMEINGQATCHNCTFEDDVLIRGTPFLKASFFRKTLEIFANKVSLDACEVDRLYMTYPIPGNSLSNLFQQKVYLTNKTTVNAIIFDKPGGRVYCSQGSKVNNVENGIVE